MALSSAKSQEPAYGRSRHQRTISSPQQVVCSTLPEIKRFSLPHRTMTFSWTCERCLKGLVPEEKDDLLRARTCPLLLHARRPSLRSDLRAAAREFNNSRLITLHQSEAQAQQGHDSCQPVRAAAIAGFHSFSIALPAEGSHLHQCISTAAHIRCPLPPQKACAPWFSMKCGWARCVLRIKEVFHSTRSPYHSFEPSARSRMNASPSIERCSAV